MKTNMGSVDKTIRVVIAIAISLLYFTHTISGSVAVVLMVLATVFIITSLLGFCPLYPLFGINTKKKEKK